MSVQNFSSLAGLKVAEKFGVRWGGFQVTTVSNSNISCFRVALSQVNLSYHWVLTIISQLSKQVTV